MSKILLINGGHHFGHSGGRLNDTLHETACQHLSNIGHDIQETQIKQGYDVQTEVKKYMDEVYTEGHGSLYESDGRTRSNPEKQYGTGGLLQGRHYMLSVTWNAPKEAFNQVGNFFDSRGVDGVYFAFHKSQQFLGMRNLPSFMINDVIKDPKIEQYITEYKNHLTETFKK